MTLPLRVAFFTDSFREANGVATLSREFAAFAQSQQLPFLCVHSGAETRVLHHESVTTLELKRGPMAFPVDHGLYCDPLLSRFKNWATAQLRCFDPDLVHITGPGDMGILGFWVAHSLRVPLVASWHTNLHEYAARRLEKFFHFLPKPWRERVSHTAERQSLRACIRFYGLARFTLAPNQAMIHLLQERTHRPAFLIAHGVDPEVFSPSRRTRRNGSFCIGYVGRFTPEKNVRFMAKLEHNLLAAGQHDFNFMLVGEGSDKEWLRKNLRSGQFPGVLHGDALADAFANMDVFVFPSRTDTFGLVLLEAMASGVPIVVSPEAGRNAGVQHGVSGFHAEDLDSVTQSVLQLMKSEALRREMGAAAREFGRSRTWSSVFQQLYGTYAAGLETIDFATSGLRRPAAQTDPKESIQD